MASSSAAERAASSLSKRSLRGREVILTFSGQVCGWGGVWVGGSRSYSPSQAGVCGGGGEGGRFYSPQARCVCVWGGGAEVIITFSAAAVPDLICPATHCCCCYCHAVGH